MRQRPVKERPIALPIQPHPLATKPAYYRVDGTLVTAIARTWADGDERRCRLCEVCSATEGICNIIVKGRIPRKLCTFFSTLGMKRQACPSSVGPVVRLLRGRGDNG